ncbi:MAG: GNAT family N-acetyltransferase [Phycisphaerae bacterium]|nr:GNAT family N-acetyltransferase [Phycisphaerae bacterium]
MTSGSSEHDKVGIVYRVAPPVNDADLNELFVCAWPSHSDCNFGAILKHSLTYVCAYEGPTLIGFVNVAWDGGIHAFILDPTVHPDWQRRGVGRTLIQRAAAVACERGVEWLHVDYRPHLEHFYQSCGFRPTSAGLLQLQAASR